MFRLNPDEQYRKTQREHVVSNSLESEISLLIKRLRAGLLDTEDCRQAAIFGHKAAAQLLEIQTNQLSDQLALISTFTRRKCLNLCAALGYHVIQYYAETIIGSNSSSEERALSEVSESYQDQVSYILRAPHRALNQIENKALSPAGVTARQATETIQELWTVETVLSEYQLDGKAQANRHVISSLECGLHCVVFKTKKQATRQAIACYHQAIEATKRWHSCSEREAINELSLCILERLFPNV